MLNRLTVKTKLYFVITFMALLLLIIGVMGLNGMQNSNTALGSVYQDRLRPALILGEIQYLMQNNIVQLNLATMHDTRLEEHVLHDHPIQQHTNHVRGNTQKINKLWAEFMDRDLSEQETLLASEYTRLRREFVEVGLEGAYAFFESGQFPEANNHLVKVTNPTFTNSVAFAEQLLDYQREIAAHLFEEQQAAYSKIRLISIVMILSGILLAAFIGWLLIRSIVNPLNRAVGYFNEISDGNLNNHIQIDNQDEIGAVLSALQAMQDRLRSLVTDIKTSVDSINTASQEIAAGNIDLSQRTEEQASSLEETAASLEELTSTVRQNAENARQANQLAQNASDTAIEGGEKSRQVVATMEEISESSSKIANIIKLIDDIAFQTNILALNAAVEAARAGDQGRGFAVVAEEVRSLAQRSATASREISDLITSSVQTVKQGAVLVEETGTTILDIVNSVQRVSDIIGEISAASDEQSQGIEQVNQAVIQMDDVTQQNAALVEEAAAAAESLQEQAETLSEAVAIFDIDAATSKPTTPSLGRPSVKPNLTIKKTKPATKTAPKAMASNSSARLATKPLPKSKQFNDDEWEEF